jgi:hypothetical protein
MTVEPSTSLHGNVAVPVGSIILLHQIRATR